MNKLLKKIDEKGIKKKFFAEKLGIAYSYLNIKLQNPEKFSALEIRKVGEILNLTLEEINEIFLLRK
ncbi:helix-turn-helix domain-containing protein [Fusobacterium gastrosuis]|uniref:helix-turn-helix domain-containing protein n=1 Tax=Fusobacterium gastrosuis TaxID=1755100 RepID=UPI002974030C|nr:hypothetical protein [Fusobacteriaceae bacterium]MDY5714271.1 hypothetical protein [Fusobacterium gastrosuis]